MAHVRGRHEAMLPRGAFGSSFLLQAHSTRHSFQSGTYAEEYVPAASVVVFITIVLVAVLYNTDCCRRTWPKPILPKAQPPVLMVSEDSSTQDSDVLFFSEPGT